jgi:hypothetical protein
VETNAFGNNTPFFFVPDLNLTCAFPISTSFRWLIVFFARSIDVFGPFEVQSLYFLLFCLHFVNFSLPLYLGLFL